ncbi:MAG: SurA N-terminal domain-containing protein [Parachlamydiales bacterium]|jgi:hypothetical protein
MLSFLRKYQKIFFVIIAVVIVVTFSFFGTQGVISEVKKVKDEDIAQAVDGSKIKLSEIEKMSLFLSSDSEDYSIKQTQIRANLFNDGVLKNDIFQSGIAKIIFEKYFDKLAPSLKSKFEKAKKYRPFVHYYDSSISAEAIWQNYKPEISDLLKKVKEQKELNLEFCKLYIDLYNEQMNFHPESLRKIIYFQEKQKNAQTDPRILQDSFAIFGYDNAVEWFGKDFIDLISQFIINTSHIAESKGYKVSVKEVNIDLMTNLKKALKNQTDISLAESYKRMLKILGMDDKSAIDVWQKVMLFRKYYKDVSNTVLLDNLPYKEFLDFSATTAKVKVYDLPKHLQMNNFEDLMQLEMYLMATADKSGALDIPNSFKAIDQIEKEYPQLIEKQYQLNVKHTNLRQAAQKIKVKDMYFWQLDDKNYSNLRKNFKYLPEANSRKEKLDVFDNLEVFQKMQVNDYSRISMVKENLSIIDEALNNEEAKFYDFYITLADPSFPIHFQNTAEVVELIDKNDSVAKYTQDNDNFYQIEVVKRDQNKQLVSFEKAKNQEIIAKILDDYLVKEFEDLKKSNPKFKDVEDFDSVRSEVASIAFSEIISKLKALNLSKELSNDAVSKYRLYPYVENILKNISTNENFMLNLNNQFQLSSRNIDISRSKNPNWIEKIAFSMEEKKFSKLNFKNDGNIEFIYLEAIQKPTAAADKVDIARDKIAKETSQLLTKKLIQELMDKNCIVIPVKEICE